MASSSTPQQDYDVFVSFQREDTRHNIVSHLYKALVDKRIRTFRDDRDLEGGEVFSEFSDLRKYIEGSKIAVVVVSQSYSTSVWCLDELQTILRFHDQGRLLVLPVFYKVSISDIRRPSGTLKEPYMELREGYPEKVEAWWHAITKLTKLTGLHFHDLSDEGEMVEIITTEVQAMLSDLDIPSNQSLTLTDQLTTEVSELELMGLDRHMKSLYKLLDLNKSNEEIRLIGIWGPGGVGKTTLARFAYDHLNNNFHTHMFLDNAENIHYQDPGTSRSEETLTSRFQEGTQNKTRGQVSTAMVKSTVGHRNSLVVIDCVDNLEQLKTVAEIVKWCGSGSRVILITQDKNLLDQFGVEHVYEVKSLRYDEALKLFSVFAFASQYPPASFESLSLRAVQMASFLPLTLKILGSFLQNKNEEEWEKELQKLEGDREKRIIKMMTKTYKREDDKDQIPSFVFK